MNDLASRLESASPDLIALAERVERAEGPSRDLDAAIWWLAVSSRETDPPEDAERLGFDRDPAKALDAWCGPGWRTEGQFPLAFTASIDAALTLVPEGAGRGAFAMNRDRFGQTHCNVWTDVEFNRKCHGSGATPALALCAAALRAKATA